MTRLTRDQQTLILKIYFHCSEPEEAGRGCDLIASNPQAAELYALLEEALADADPLHCAVCPETLSKLTVARLKLAARAK